MEELIKCIIHTSLHFAQWNPTPFGGCNIPQYVSEMFSLFQHTTHQMDYHYPPLAILDVQEDSPKAEPPTNKGKQ